MRFLIQEQIIFLSISIFPGFCFICCKTRWLLPLFQIYFLHCWHWISLQLCFIFTGLFLCILEHDVLAEQMSHSSPFMLTLTALPCPLADLFIGSVLSLRPHSLSRHRSNISSSLPSSSSSSCCWLLSVWLLSSTHYSSTLLWNVEAKWRTQPHANYKCNDTVGFQNNCSDIILIDCLGANFKANYWFHYDYQM